MSGNNTPITPLSPNAEAAANASNANASNTTDPTVENGDIVKDAVDLFKMIKIPILPSLHTLSIELPKRFDLKKLRKQLGITTSSTVNDTTAVQLVSVAGETISFVPTGLEQLEPTYIDISGFKTLYVPEDFEKEPKKIKRLIKTYKFVFPFTKMGKPVEEYSPPCTDKLLTNWKLTNALLESLNYRLKNLRKSIIEQRFLPQDTVDLRSQIAHFRLLDNLITALGKNALKNNCLEEKEEAEPLEEDDLTRLLQKFALLLLLRKRDASTDIKGIVDQLDKEYKIDLKEFPEIRKPIREFITLTLKKTPTSGGGNEENIENEINDIDTEMQTLSGVIQSLEIKDTPSKKEARELVKKQKELNSLSKKRVALEEKLYEMENSGVHTVKTEDLPHLVDSVIPELQNSKFLKFEKELNEKLGH